jgi:hypothetical protein
MAIASMRHSRAVALLLLFSLALCACGRTGIKVASAEPTAPDAPVLLIRLDVGNFDWFFNRHVADYLSDGTVIRWAEGPDCEPGRPCGRLETNTLTAAGLAALRRLLAEDADLWAQPRGGVSQNVPDEPWFYQANVVNTVVLDRPDGSRYTFSAPSARSRNAASWAPNPTAERLDALAETMRDPVTLVGPAGLVNPTWETYRPAKMAVFIRISEADPRALWTDRSFAGPEYSEFSETDWPLESLPDTFGTAFDAPEGAVNRCGFVAGTDIEAVIAGLPADGGKTLATGQLAAGRSWGHGGMLWRAKSPPMIISMWIVALMPEDGAVSCLDARSY